MGNAIYRFDSGPVRVRNARHFNSSFLRDKSMKHLVAATVTDYQQWAAYPDSPELTSSYPYQAITRYLTFYYVFMSPSRLFYTGGYINSSGTSDAAFYSLNGSVWEGGNFNETQLPADEVIEANYDVYISQYTGDPPPDVYFAKSTTGGISTWNRINL